jgi:transposase
MVDEALKALDGRFNEIYGEDGRKSIPPERLLRALLLQMFYTIRSERMLMEQLEYNLLFRWFVGLSANEPVWHPTVFTKNRDRLLEGAVAEEFFSLIVNQARQKQLLSDEHFTVDGTLVEAWAGQKSFQTKRESTAPKEPPSQDAGSNPTVNFRKEKRSNQTHQPAGKRVTLGGDRGYDTKGFVEKLRDLQISPHVAQNTTNRRSAIDERTTRHEGYAVSQRKRKRVEEVFGWLKTVALQRKTRFRGPDRVGWMFTFAAAAYNLVRMRNLMAQAA